MASISTNYAIEEKKNVLIYFYKDGQVSIHFKALSTSFLLQDDFAFVSLSDPSESLAQGLGISTYPSLGGILKSENG